jgi:hypothetical protein
LAAKVGRGCRGYANPAEREVNLNEKNKTRRVPQIRAIIEGLELIESKTQSRKNLKKYPSAKR